MIYCIILSNTRIFNFEAFFEDSAPSYSGNEVYEMAMKLMSAHWETSLEQSAPQVIIDVKEYLNSPPKSIGEGKKFWIEKLNLQGKYRQILAHSIQWLTDDIIDASTS